MESRKYDWRQCRMAKRRIPRGWRRVIVGIPLAAAAGASLLPLQRFGQRFVILIVLLWIQVFFIFECFLAGK
jgi:hypothetical protein